MRKLIVPFAIAVIAVAIGLIVLLVDWTPKEEKIDAHRTAFEEELEAMTVSKSENSPTSSTDGTVEATFEEATVVMTEVSVAKMVEDTSEEVEEIEAVDSIDDASVTKSDMLQATTKPIISGNEVKDQWVQDAIDRNRGEINEADLARGAEIYNKLDTLYMLDLADGGLTEEEKLEVQAYMDSILTAEEQVIAWSLYNKYIHLLNE